VLKNIISVGITVIIVIIIF